MNRLEDLLYNKLLSGKLVSEEKLDKAVGESSRLHTPFSTCLLDNGYIEEGKLLSIMSDLTNIPFVNLREVPVEEAAIRAVPAKFTWHYKLVPLKIEGDKLTLAVNNPLSVSAQDELRLILGYQILTVLARREQIAELLKDHYGLGADTVGKMVERRGRATTEEISLLQPAVEDIEKMAGDASVIRLVNQIILEAYKKRATDIHIEPYNGKLRLRYRIDGVLQNEKVPGDVNRFMMAIFSRIKIMSNLNIVERRIPQDGRTIVRTQDEVLDLRVSFMPTPHGESVVIRILPTKRFYNLQSLGLHKSDLAMLESLIKKPSGIIFVTGPTGSGKTTTLYACLREINRMEKKIVTIEDPIEYEMEDAIQVQVNEGIGLTFARGLRSMLRHDPDIMMIGEVRDRETAEIAIRIALTGHLVFSTLHTNDAATSVTRLVDIGIEPYLVASSVEAFIAQRLVRIICPKCKVKNDDVDTEIKKQIAMALRLGFKDEVKVFKGKGCEWCNFTGFYGRTAIYEILIVNPSIKRLIVEKATVEDVKIKAVENGMRTLFEDGWKKVISGITTPEEVLNVCQDLDLSLNGATRDGGSPSVYSAPDAAQRRTYFDRPSEKRVYMRIPTRILLQYRLVEKGAGEIIKIERPGRKKEAGFKDVFVDNIFTKKEAREDFMKEAYQEAFTTTVNISAGGLVFESQYLLPVGSIIVLKISLPEAESAIECLAKIVRVEKDLPTAFYIAVCYLDMSGSQRQMMDNFIRKESERHRRLDLKDTSF